MVQEADLVRLRRPRYVADIPDALYMVDEKPRPMGTAGVDVLAAAFPGNSIQTAVFSTGCEGPSKNSVVWYAFHLSSRFSNLGSYVETRTEIKTVAQLSEGYQFTTLVAS